MTIDEKSEQPTRKDLESHMNETREKLDNLAFPEHEGDGRSYAANLEFLRRDIRETEYPLQSGQFCDVCERLLGASDSSILRGGGKYCNQDCATRSIDSHTLPHG